jgi:hypothetical protein
LNFKRARAVTAARWAQIKHVDRAITKAATRYSGDISRIYDFVRQRIILPP